jgi:hypothetical protein
MTIRLDQEGRSRTANSFSILSAALFAVLGLSASDASAYSWKVKMACKNDYYAHCSQYSPGSPEVRSCMRAVGGGLSRRCIDALVADGETTAGETRRAAALESRDDDDDDNDDDKK